MNETLTTVRGTVITDPTTRRVGDDQVFTFRVASNIRYQDRNTGEWKTGGTLYFSANCWGRLAQRAPGSVCKGDGIIVHGRLLTNEYERDGRLNRDLEMRVTALGPDLSRMDVTVRRAATSDPALDVGGGQREAADAPSDPDEVMAIGSVDGDDPEGDPDEAADFAEAASV
ncbi:single-stranded DNA-binding protein [Dietzia sp. UBA5065]|jgi:single-strand DNA-binding protein|uniref:single-stranded DNA-binding protein n=1 Tax=Dietzia sp. UBA5065 TaxID=1946422 RepID=UPI0025C429CF|nr:single-stranded DNA-binding protein [Dietzia sp. UBA5065]